MMHVLYELGKPDHQFRLRFKGNYLRDAHTFEVNELSLYRKPLWNVLSNMKDMI